MRASLHCSIQSHAQCREINCHLTLKHPLTSKLSYSFEQNTPDHKKTSNLSQNLLVSPGGSLATAKRFIQTQKNWVNPNVLHNELPGDCA